jgi:hypothetical protein
MQRHAVKKRDPEQWRGATASNTWRSVEGRMVAHDILAVLLAIGTVMG